MSFFFCDIGQIVAKSRAFSDDFVLSGFVKFVKFKLEKEQMILRF